MYCAHHLRSSLREELELVSGILTSLVNFLLRSFSLLNCFSMLVRDENYLRRDKTGWGDKFWNVLKKDLWPRVNEYRNRVTGFSEKRRKTKQQKNTKGRAIIFLLRGGGGGVNYCSWCLKVLPTEKTRHAQPKRENYFHAPQKWPNPHPDLSKK